MGEAGEAEARVRRRPALRRRDLSPVAVVVAMVVAVVVVVAASDIT